jgi:hypothetical protein
VKIFGTNFTLTLGAWRIRFVFAIEDEPDDRTAAMSHVRCRVGACDHVHQVV